MTVRYYLSKIVYSPGILGWHPKPMDYPTDSVNSITSGDVSKTGAWALCAVEAQDHTKILADPDIKALPDMAFDNKLSTLTAATRTALTTNLTAFGVTGISTTTTTAFRTVLRGIGRKHISTFSEDNFSASVSSAEYRSPVK